MWPSDSVYVTVSAIALDALFITLFLGVCGRVLGWSDPSAPSKATFCTVPCPNGIKDCLCKEGISKAGVNDERDEAYQRDKKWLQHFAVDFKQRERNGEGGGGARSGGDAGDDDEEGGGRPPRCASLDDATPGNGKKKRKKGAHAARERGDAEDEPELLDMSSGHCYQAPREQPLEAAGATPSFREDARGSPERDLSRLVSQRREAAARNAMVPPSAPGSRNPSPTPSLREDTRGSPERDLSRLLPNHRRSNAPGPSPPAAGRARPPKRSQGELRGPSDDIAL